MKRSLLLVLSMIAVLTLTLVGVGSVVAMAKAHPNTAFALSNALTGANQQATKTDACVQIPSITTCDGASPFGAGTATTINCINPIASSQLDPGGTPPATQVGQETQLVSQGTEIGTVALWYSPRCMTYFAVAGPILSSSTMRVNVSVIDRGGLFGLLDYSIGPVQHEPDGSVWTGMIYRSDDPVQACATITLSDGSIVSGCTLTDPNV